VVVDKITKYTHFIGIKRTNSKKQIIETFCKNVYKLHEFLRIIVSDRDAKFKSYFWKELFKQVGTSLDMSSQYHPQIDGKTKIINKRLEAYLSCFVTDKQIKWLQWLHLDEWRCNSTYHTSTKMTPFPALYGYEPPKWRKFVIREMKNSNIEGSIRKKTKRYFRNSRKN